MEYIENDFTDALIDHFEDIENVRHMTNSEFINQLRYIIDSYINSDIKIDTITNELLTEEDFILLLNIILNNYVERNFNRT